LLKAGLPDGAYYLAGYSVECGLKACVAKETKRYDFPDKSKVNASHTHDLKELIKLANLEVARVEEARNDAEFRNNWDLVQQWSERSRYQHYATNVAKAMVDAVGDGKHGVMTWINRYW
jgi:HEPN domain-containing protein